MHTYSKFARVFCEKGGMARVMSAGDNMLYPLNDDGVLGEGIGRRSLPEFVA